MNDAQTPVVPDSPTKTVYVPTVTYYKADGKQWYTVVEKTTSLVFPLSSTFEVTPTWAKEVMDNRNTRNRRLDSKRVNKYAREILNDRWIVNNDDICFLKDGTLINGQHRLAAVIASGVTVTMSFKFGLTEDAMETVDEGKSRTNLDIIHIMQEEGTGKTLAASNFVLEQLGLRRTMPRREQLAFHRRHLEAAQFACQLKKSPFARNPIHAALLRAYYHVNHERLAEFIRIIQTGIYDGNPQDAAAVRLRNFIEAHRQAHSGPARTEMYKKAASAIYHFCKFSPITKLYGMSEELFPLPEEKVQK